MGWGKQRKRGDGVCRIVWEDGAGAWHFGWKGPVYHIWGEVDNIFEKSIISGQKSKIYSESR